jgi:hypothetical protein
MPSDSSKPRSDLRRLLCAAALTLCAVACGGPFDDYTVEFVELRSAPRLEFLRARSGMKFLQVMFEFENRSGEDLVLRALDFSLRDTTGRLHPFSAQVIYMGQPMATAEVTLGSKERRRGSVVFQVSSGVVPSEMVYMQDVQGGLSISFESSD